MDCCTTPNHYDLQCTAFYRNWTHKKFLLVLLPLLIKFFPVKHYIHSIVTVGDGPYQMNQMLYFHFSDIRTIGGYYISCNWIMQESMFLLHKQMKRSIKGWKQAYLRPGSSVVSADNIAATIKASDKQPYSFASNRVLDREGSSGSSAETRLVSEERGFIQALT